MLVYPCVEGMRRCGLVVRTALPSGTQCAPSILPQSRHSARWGSSSQDAVNTFRKLKPHLKKFYLKVHPDLYSAHSAERKTNEQSLKTLLSMVQSLRQRGGDVDRDDRSRLDADLKFFVRKQDPDKTEKEGPTTFDEINATVRLSGEEPPPTRQRVIFGAIWGLFLKAGILGGAEDRKSLLHEVVTSMTPTLTEFFANNIEKARELMEIHKSTERDLIIRKAALRSVRGVSVVTEEAATGLTMPQTLDMFAALVRLIEARPSLELSGLYLAMTRTVAEGAGLYDEHGKILLPLDQREDWAAMLDRINIAEVQQLRLAQEELHLKESRVSKILGVRHVYAESHPFSTTLHYRAFLDRVITECAGAAVPDVGTLSVKVVREAPKEGGFLLCPQTHSVSLPYDCSLDAIQEVLSTCTSELSHVQLDSHHTAVWEKRLIPELRRQLRLAHLWRHPDLHPHHMTDACLKMRKFTQELLPYTHGLNIEVAGEFRLHGSGKVTIPWDFEI